MRSTPATLVLYTLLGGGLVFAVLALFRFIEPEGSNLVQVSLVIGILLGIAIGIILDRTVQQR